MMKLVDMSDLESDDANRIGSSPINSTKKKWRDVRAGLLK